MKQVIDLQMSVGEKVFKAAQKMIQTNQGIIYELCLRSDDNVLIVSEFVWNKNSWRETNIFS